ncbi:MAG: thioesterase II family protein [Gammaproteobacteria bacterium]
MSMTAGLSKNRWLRIPRAVREARLRLFCLPYAGGAATVFSAWPALVPGALEICAVQLPGRENRINEKPLTHLPDLVERLVIELEPWLNKPFALFGHSLGAMIAFEWARQLTGRYRPVHLFLSACPAPDVPRRTALHNLPDEAFIKALQERYRQIPEAVAQNPELMQLLLPMLRADLTLYETHVPLDDNPLHCPISVFGGLQDDLVDSGKLGAWRRWTTADFNQCLFPGGHFYLRTAQAPLLRTMARTLNLEENP